MATITPALAGVSPVSLYGEMAVASFTLPAVGDNSAALEYAEFADRSVQVTTANWGGSTLVLQGSNDGVTWFTLTDPQGNPIKASAPSPLDRLLGLFEPPTAEAHGLPWDLWTVNADGTGLRRLTTFYEDLPMAVFSPDGKQLAVMALGGIYLMDADGSRLRRIDQVGDHGGLDWPWE